MSLKGRICISVPQTSSLPSATGWNGLGISQPYCLAFPERVSVPVAPAGSETASCLEGGEPNLKPQVTLWKPWQADPERERDGPTALEVAQLHAPNPLFLSLQDVQVPVCPLCNTPVPVRRGEMPDVVVGEHIDRDCKSDPAQRKRKVGTRCC